MTATTRSGSQHKHYEVLGGSQEAERGGVRGARRGGVRVGVPQTGPFSTLLFARLPAWQPRTHITRCSEWGLPLLELQRR
jgi:hypothetical protein